MTPGVLGGKPRIAGRRVSVQQIVILHERLGRSADTISSELDIGLADIYSALAYYFDHRGEIDASITEDAALARAMKAELASKIPGRLGV
jgi:uncharacterized protein (DUF433 family)